MKHSHIHTHTHIIHIYARKLVLHKSNKHHTNNYMLKLCLLISLLSLKMSIWAMQKNFNWNISYIFPWRILNDFIIFLIIINFACSIEMHFTFSFAKLIFLHCNYFDLLFCIKDIHWEGNKQIKHIALYRLYFIHHFVLFNILFSIQKRIHDKFYGF